MAAREKGNMKITMYYGTLKVLSVTAKRIYAPN